MGVEEARACGFVSNIIVPEQLLAEALALAKEIEDVPAAQSMKHQFVENQPGLFLD
jgi:enoyl-CoA hydratase/carnithine racemase